MAVAITTDLGDFRIKGADVLAWKRVASHWRGEGKSAESSGLYYHDGTMPLRM
jgi:predicted alpha/beta-fold hydrolase